MVPVLHFLIRVDSRHSRFFLVSYLLELSGLLGLWRWVGMERAGFGKSAKVAKVANAFRVAN